MREPLWLLLPTLGDAFEPRRVQGEAYAVMKMWGTLKRYLGFPAAVTMNQSSVARRSPDLLLAGAAAGSGK